MSPRLVFALYSDCLFPPDQCDEQRPRCITCTMTERDCNYASDLAPTASAFASPAASAASSVSSPDPGHGDVTLPQLPQLTEVSFQPVPTESSVDADVNITHMELLINFSIEDQAPYISKTLREPGTRLVIRYGLEYPYLLYVILAISARHLAVQKPDKVDFYLQHAFQLQTRAISLFNETRVEVNRATCVPLLLFSSTLSRHLLTDVLARRDSDLNVFMDHFMASAQMHTGIRAVAHAAWPLLLESDLSPYMVIGRELGHKPIRGSECDRIRDFVSSPAADLAEPERAIYLEAIRLIQIGIDETTRQDADERYHMIFTWAVMVSPEFSELLAQRQPTALAVFAHYALLLHRGRELWQVGDAGAYLIPLIARHLGPEWDHCLSVLRESLTAVSS